jgi:Co/Zn/Cd efflux system component
MGMFGAFVLGQVLYKIAYRQLPTFEAMGVVGALALAANGVCFVLLWRHRGEDINMRSVWLCSRNDLAANTSVLAAAVGVWAMGSPWPDVAVGALICAMFLRSAFVVVREARAELRANHAQPSVAADAPQPARR